MHLQAVTCAVQADRPHEWADVVCALWKAQVEAKRQGIDDPTCEILTPDPEWYERHVRYAGPLKKRDNKPIAVLAMGWAEKE